MAEAGTVIVVNRCGMGEADQVLQHRLISSYLKLMDEHDILPTAICFYTEGIHLAVNGSPVLDTLKSLEKKGVRIWLCSTCLQYYNLVDQVNVGTIGEMKDILEAESQASKVITL